MTEGVSQYYDTHQSTQNIKNFFSRTQTDDRSFYDKSSSQFSKSTHTAKQSVLVG